MILRRSSSLKGWKCPGSPFPNGNQIQRIRRWINFFYCAGCFPAHWIHSFAGMVFVIAGIMVLITAGLSHDFFIKKHPSIKPFYPAELIEKYDKKFAVLISSSIGLMLVGVMWLVGSSALPLPDGCTRSLYTAVFIAVLAVSITAMTYAGMQKDKYDIEKYNKVNSPEAKAKEKANEDNPLSGKSAEAFS